MAKNQTSTPRVRSDVGWRGDGQWARTQILELFWRRSCANYTAHQGIPERRSLAPTQMHAAAPYYAANSLLELPDLARARPRGRLQAARIAARPAETHRNPREAIAHTFGSIVEAAYHLRRRGGGCGQAGSQCYRRQEARHVFRYLCQVDFAPLVASLGAVRQHSQETALRPSEALYRPRLSFGQVTIRRPRPSSMSPSQRSNSTRLTTSARRCRSGRSTTKTRRKQARQA